MNWWEINYAAMACNIFGMADGHSINRASHRRCIAAALGAISAVALAGGLIAWHEWSRPQLGDYPRYEWGGAVGYVGDVIVHLPNPNALPDAGGI